MLRVEGNLGLYSLHLSGHRYGFMIFFTSTRNGETQNFWLPKWNFCDREVLQKWQKNPDERNCWKTEKDKSEALNAMEKLFYGVNWILVSIFDEIKNINTVPLTALICEHENKSS